MKSKIGMLLTIVMLLSIAVPVFAAPQTGDLTINGTTAGKVYDLYKVFDLTHSGDNYSYTVTDEFANFFADEKYGDNPVAYVENLKGNADGLANLAKDLLAWAIANNKPTKTVTGTADTTIVNDLDYGYYLMNPNGGSNPTDSWGTMFSLGTVLGEDTEIELKAEYPTIDKVIVEGRGSRY